MKPSTRKRFYAFTLLELLVVALVAMILFLLLLPMNSGPRRPSVNIRCINNVKQIAIAMHMFAQDNEDKFPTQATLTNGPANLDQAPQCVKVPLLLQPYLGNVAPWTCPTDRLKQRSTNSLAFGTTNVSYFLSLDVAPSNATALLVGDRHLQEENRPVKPGIFALKTNANVSWTRELHAQAWMPSGTLGFVDGHAEFSATNLVSIVRRQPLASNRLLVP